MVVTRRDVSKRDPNFQAKTFVDQIVDAVFEWAAAGTLLPGDRILEVELAAKLGVSRAPIREALRILETQGLIESVPYRGMRIFAVTADLVRELNVVRCELEDLAIREVAGRGGMKPLIAGLERLVEDMALAARQGRRRDAAHLDAEFHTTIVNASGNRILESVWASLRPRLEIIFAIACFKRNLAELCTEHRELVEELRHPTAKRLSASLREHIITDNVTIDYEAIIEERRRARERA
jgi:DNA-binding GntR family transcriptional regulator